MYYLTYKFLYTMLVKENYLFLARFNTMQFLAFSNSGGTSFKLLWLRSYKNKKYISVTFCLMYFKKHILFIYYRYQYFSIKNINYNHCPKQIYWNTFRQNHVYNRIHGNMYHNLEVFQAKNLLRDSLIYKFVMSAIQSPQGTQIG